MNETKTTSQPEAVTPKKQTEPISQQEDTVTDMNTRQSPDIGSNTDESPERKEHTRSKMALLFVLGFFAILFLCFIYAMNVGAKLSELKDTLIGVIGALSGTLGFIVGYYYKSTFEQ